MRYPLKMTANLAKYVASKRFRGAKKFPMVMMLEPLHACNLTCTGCGRIREYKSTINEIMTVEQCLAASDECGAPVVSICGGEPMIYPEIGRLTQRNSGARAAHYSVHQRHVHPQAAARIQADFQFLLQRASGRPGADARSLRRDATACFAKPSRASRPRRPRDSWSARIPRFTKKPTSTKLPICTPIWTRWASTDTCFRRPTATRPCRRRIFSCRARTFARNSARRWRCSTSTI